ncbi:MAG TPA: vanadium-dependent haloperoxidase, partial [Myxococcaceae bacterium]
VSDAHARAAGSALGRRAAAATVALRSADGANAVSLYRPATAPGVYVTTPLPVGFVWGKVKPWGMQNGSQFRPQGPPALSSADWARAYNEVKDLGGKASTTRTAAQSEVARFWEMTGPGAYKEIVASAARAPGRSLLQNARLLALASMAMADSYIAIFDAKYTYNFWRPLTAIRNGDIDGNDATALEAGWLPLIDTPMHPEYPCAHCINVAAVCAVLSREFGGRVPPLTSTSSTAPGVTHSWTRVEDLVDEVSNARVWGGVHYRSSTVVGAAMGKKIGEQVTETALRPGR